MPKNPKAGDRDSLGPACLVVVIVLGLAFSLTMTVIAWIMIGREPSQASGAIDNQLIPWVQQSVLEPTDKASILERLEELSESIKKGELDSHQLVRLRNRLSDSPILQWGTVQQVQQAIAKSGLSEQEKEASVLTCDRFLRSAVEQWLEMGRMGWALEKVANMERLSGRLIIKSEISDDALRDFLNRATALADKAKTPNERFEKSVAQAFRISIDAALAEPKDK